MSLWAVLATGLLAGGASCAAVQGGLLAGAVARRHPEPVVAATGKARRVVGTSPLFAAIGYAARRSTSLLRGRLSVLAAVAVLIAGLVSVNTGLVLADSSVTLTSALGALIPATDPAPTGQQEYLPETGDTDIDLGTLEPGQLRFTCAMGMYSGSIEVTA